MANYQDKLNVANEKYDEYCPCCGHPYVAERFPLFGPLKALGELGEGFPLYYHMVKWVIYAFLLALLISGVYCLHENYQEKKISEWADTLDGNMIMEGSLANFGRHSTPSLTQPWLHVGCMWLFLLLHSFLLHRHKAMSKDLDKHVITPSDYTCEVSKLPRDLDVQDFKQFVEERSGPVWEVLQAFDVNELKSATESVLFLRRKLRKMERSLDITGLLPRSKRCFVCPGPVESLEALHRLIAREEDRLSRAQHSKTDNFTGTAYVIFEQDEGNPYCSGQKVRS